MSALTDRMTRPITVTLEAQCWGEIMHALDAVSSHRLAYGKAHEWKGNADEALDNVDETAQCLQDELKGEDVCPDLVIDEEAQK